MALIYSSAVNKRINLKAKRSTVEIRCHSYHQAQQYVVFVFLKYNKFFKLILYKTKS